MTYTAEETQALMEAQSAPVAQEEKLTAPEPAPAGNAATPEDIASSFYTLFHAKVAQGVQHLSNKDLRRVLMALVEVPHLRSEHGITDEAAKNVYLWTDQLLKSKIMMELSVLYASGVLDQIPETIDNPVEVSHTEEKEVNNV